jgi:hypothetical protein
LLHLLRGRRTHRKGLRLGQASEQQQGHKMVLPLPLQQQEQEQVVLVVVLVVLVRFRGTYLKMPLPMPSETWGAYTVSLLGRPTHLLP